MKLPICLLLAPALLAAQERVRARDLGVAPGIYQEAIYNALFMATTVSGSGNRVEAIPFEEVKRILARRGVVR